MKSLIFLLTAIAIVGVCVSQAPACSCSLLTPLEQLNVSDIVVTASVVSVNDVDAGNGAVVSRALVSVESVWKGQESGNLVVETTASGTCGFTLTAGTKYLIYANRFPDEELFTTHYCMRTQPAEFASTDFEELGPPQGVSTGTVTVTWGYVKTRY